MIMMPFAVLNTRSVRKKTLPVKDLVVDQDVDIFAITESWLSSESDEFIIRDLCLTGYEFHNVPRGSRGVDLAFYIRALYISKSNRVSRVNSSPLNLWICY